MQQCTEVEAPSRATKPGFETFSSREVVLNGLIAAKTERTLTVKTLTETLTVERGEVAGLRESTLSLMPEGLLEALTEEQACDLIAYLMHKSQAPLPAAGK